MTLHSGREQKEVWDLGSTRFGYNSLGEPKKAEGEQKYMHHSTATSNSYLSSTGLVQVLSFKLPYHSILPTLLTKFGTSSFR